jgi:hypothetical protein
MTMKWILRAQVLSLIAAFADGAAHSGDDESLKLGFEIATSLADEAPSFAASLAASSAPSSVSAALHEARSASVRLL